ncbi:amino acid permease [Anaerolineales bacterium HSG25]|nr:amino acid permease [Anaerolineales bacterium HSG25]
MTKRRTLTGTFSVFAEQVSTDNKENSVSKFGTFGGVFTPNVLTILGVIMYLRLGWVIGNAGLLGAIMIILMAKIITICTGLSMASITTNIRIGAGGAYSIISHSLGLEAGGSIGIPLYIAQTLSAALYIIGFTEGWLRVFPDHPAMVISLIAWLILTTISYVSAQFAIRIQYVIMAIMALSLVSFLFTPLPVKPLEEVVWIGGFEDASFWQVFAVFFPAVTGIMAGANMSGDLEDPRRAIPIGTLGAIAVTLVIYIGLAVVLALVAMPEEMRLNQMVMVDLAWNSQLVVAGIMGATLSSALGSMLGAPRILQALAEHKTIPLHKTFAAKTARNEPGNAIILTSGIIFVALIIGDLNALASLITMFFLITYGMLNVVVFLQQSIKIISFRPSFKIPRIVPLFGGVSCIFMMFFIDPLFSVIAILTIVGVYIWLMRQELDANWGDIRGGLFVALAERASRMAERFPKHHISWKPDLLVPIEDPKMWAGSLLFIKNITYPSGSIFAFNVAQGDYDIEDKTLHDILLPLKQQGILVNSVVIDGDQFLHGAKTVIQTLRGGAFRPNTLFLTISGDIFTSSYGRVSPEVETKQHQLNELVRIASRYEMGIILMYQHPQIAFGMQQEINLWLRDKSPNWHLAMLITLQLQVNWNGTINLITVANDQDSEASLYEFLEFLSDQARLPSTTKFHVLLGSFSEALKTAPRADLNIFGLSLGKVPLNFVRQSSETLKSSCLFVKDSGQENALV